MKGEGNANYKRNSERGRGDEGGGRGRKIRDTLLKGGCHGCVINLKVRHGQIEKHVFSL